MQKLRMGMLGLASVFGALSLGFKPSDDDQWEPLAKKDRNRPASSRAYFDAIQKTANMVQDSQATRLASRYDLDILNLTWEDTGRYKNSAVGPNISDMTIQVGTENPRTGRFEVSAMPVIRFPNFSDVTTDIDPSDFTLLVGNHRRGGPLKRVSLRDFLETPTRYLSDPSSWRGRNRTLLTPRDEKVLVSAQACFLPVPQRGKATFNPVLFNYQSVSGDPAVLTILATREGTSVTVIDNKRDAFRTGDIWGQRLFHNAYGMRASLTGQRESDFNAGNIDRQPTHERPKATPGMSMVLLIQVPLKQKNASRFQDATFGVPSAPATEAKGRRGGSDVESAIIGHGKIEGPFTEIDNLAIERDPRFPVRVTVQFYKATSNGVVSEADMRQIKKDIEMVYDHGDVVGSLVTGGHTGRPTEYDGMKVQPRGWWEAFWRRHERNTGDTRDEAIRKLRRLLGNDYQERPVCELYLRDVLRS